MGRRNYRRTDWLDCSERMATPGFRSSTASLRGAPLETSVGMELSTLSRFRYHFPAVHIEALQQGSRESLHSRGCNFHPLKGETVRGGADNVPLEPEGFDSRRRVPDNPNARQ